MNPVLVDMDLRNGFDIPGTPFEAMFALPQTQSDSVEGSSHENPIHLRGIKVDHFRCFLRILYPLSVLMIFPVKYLRVYVKIFSIGRKPVVEFDEWIGVLNLATMWFFHDVRSLLLKIYILCSGSD